MKKINEKLNMKKGEVTTQQIVLLIILLVSFVIILFLLFRLNLGKESESEVCHNSVVLRGSSVIPSEATPLKCSRRYVCITEDGTCEGMTKPELVKVKTEAEVYSALAGEMANCWWMFGEGKVNYVGKDFTPNFYCSICAQIVFDNSLDEITNIEEKINQQKFYSSLEDKQISDEGITYLEYLTGYKKMNEFQNYLDTNKIIFDDFKFNTQYFILTGINSEVGAWKWAAIGVAAGGLIAAPFTGGTSLAITAVFIGVAGTAGGVGGYYLGIAVNGEGVDNEFVKPVVIEASPEVLKQFDCEDILTVG